MVESKVKSEIGSLLKIKDGVVIQTDNNALENYRKQKKRLNTLNNYENDIRIIKEDLKEIKELLKKLVT